ncbi:MAG: hypothetical protein JWO31_3591 [Phycisphaerales bacterium]|nr:hypothetical protein [Phycisphaerales bacterium]
MSSESDLALSVRGLSKAYTIGHRRADAPNTLAESLLARARRPFGRREEREAFRALNDVSFDVAKGEVVGIVGRNGAGKSTLLKVLSRITEPTAGEIDVYGRIGSLLEVGTGFHPELTGRENVYLNGAILGMGKSEIRRRFDAIVAFAEVERFLDTPVKRYSSGMYTRLAFAVAAHLEPEILVIDEVLAVGDQAFQDKCLGKMKELGQQGRTVLFVSHNMGAVAHLCGRAVLLDAGRVKLIGSAVDVIRAYLTDAAGTTAFSRGAFSGTLAGRVRFRDVSVSGGDGQPASALSPTAPIRIAALGESDQRIPAYRTTLSIYRDGVRLLTMHDVLKPLALPPGPFRADYEIPAFFLRPGDYSVAVGGYRDGMNEYVWGTDLTTFTIAEEWSDQFDPINIGLVNLTHTGRRTTGTEAVVSLTPTATTANLTTADHV